MADPRRFVRLARALSLALVVASIGPACNGGGSGSPSPSPSPTPPPTAQNPCATSSVVDDLPAVAPPGAASPARKREPVIDSSVEWNVLDAIYKHRAAASRGLVAEIPPQPITEDIGDIAVLQDEGDLVLVPNQFDLRDTGLRFSRNGQGGYNVTRIDGTFRSAIGSRITLGDDDSRSATVPFAFSYYGQTQTSAFVNSDGNVTFGVGDSASSERNLSRMLTGPPRVSLFFADLDPSVGGRVHLQAASDAFTVTWCDVLGFESQRLVRAQLSLLPDGTIEMKFADNTNLFDAIVGLSPGQTGLFTPVDLSATGPTDGGSAAVGERFAQSGELDTVAAARKFYRTHPDIYDQLVIWTDQRYITGSFAFEITVGNEIRGIGLSVFDRSRDFGSAGVLRSLAVMDHLGKYPDDPFQKFLGENNTLSVIGQEVGHRWLAFLRFRDHTGQRSEQLLGRDRAHWSFFFDSDASVMEGNDIEDLGGGSFRTIAAVERYSALDQYAMGLLAETDVPMFFYVGDPTNSQPPRLPDDAPRIGVTFNGTRRDVLIQDVIAVQGVRQPSAATSPKVHRQAFLYIVGAGRSTDPGQVAKLDLIRREWEAFYARATSSRGRVETRLRPPT
jgi:hypothetical protein